jgi:hypothetical protein
MAQNLVFDPGAYRPHEVEASLEDCLIFDHPI